LIHDIGFIETTSLTGRRTFAILQFSAKSNYQIREIHWPIARLRDDLVLVDVIFTEDGEKAGSYPTHLPNPFRFYLLGSDSSTKLNAAL
jgi:hypothetical protein